jgi:hypothetical protein
VCLSLESKLINTLLLFSLHLLTSPSHFTFWLHLLTSSDFFWLLLTSSDFYLWPQNQSCFTTRRLPPITSFWRQAHARPTTRIFIFELNTYLYSPYVTFSLTRGWVCRLKLLLVLASAVILRSESRGTHDHILLSQIRDSPNLEGQVLVFLSPRKWVAQL